MARHRARTALWVRVCAWLTFALAACAPATPAPVVTGVLEPAFASADGAAVSETAVDAHAEAAGASDDAGAEPADAGGPPELGLTIVPPPATPWGADTMDVDGGVVRGARWLGSSPQRWAKATRGYGVHVLPGHPSALGSAGVPFATYLNLMHNRIHPIFADSFLSSLDALPASEPRNAPTLTTTLELVLDGGGRVTDLGIVGASGVPAFDLGALEAVDRAQPFGPAPRAIVSPDGHVYMHWEFHRDEVHACSTSGARPYLLRP